MSAPALLSVFVALASGWLVCRRRAVYALGPYGPALAPTFLIAAWFFFFWLGHALGSLSGAGSIAALPLVALAVWSALSTRPRRLRPWRWSTVDWGLFLLIAVYLLLQPAMDPDIHKRLIATYLRGNVPPCVPNDPTRPISYHVLYTASAALLSSGTRLSADLALDAVSLGLTACVLSCLQALSHLLVRGSWPRQAARLFALFGFGPVYLAPRYFHSAGVDGPYWVLHGRANQSFIEAITRPPSVLAFALAAFLLAGLLPRLRSPSRPGLGARRALRPVCLLPAVALLPHAAEELLFFLALTLAWLCLRRRFAWKAAAGLAGAAAASACTSPLIGEVLWPSGGPASSPLVALWPPVLIGFMGAVPLLSLDALSTLLFEWGPVFLATLALGLSDERRRLAAFYFALSFLPPAFIGFAGDWDPLSLDRLFFYPSFLGFALCAVWVERLRSRAAAAALVLALTAGPLGLTLYRIAWRLEPPRRELAPLLRADPSPFEAALSAVGPREQILADKDAVQYLLDRGLVVAAPVHLHRGGVRLDLYDDYVARLQRKPEWYFLPKDDPRVAGLKPVAACMGRALVRVPPDR